MEARSGAGDQMISEISEEVEKTIAGKGSFRQGVSAVVSGATGGVKRGFHSRENSAKPMLSGVFDGISEAKEDFQTSKASKVKGLSGNQSPAARALMTASGVLFGVVGVMINAPGGLVLGVIESLSDSKDSTPSQMTKNTTFWATNIGKYLPPAIVGAAVGGPVGVALATGVACATGSVPSIIDGRSGLNRKIARPVENAVKEAHGEDGVKENLRAYYRAGKGAVVGFSAGIREGWKAGFQSGVDAVGNGIGSMTDSIQKSEEE